MWVSLGGVRALLGGVRRFGEFCRDLETCKAGWRTREEIRINSGFAGCEQIQLEVRFLGQSEMWKWVSYWEDVKMFVILRTCESVCRIRGNVKMFVIFEEMWKWVSYLRCENECGMWGDASQWHGIDVRCDWVQWWVDFKSMSVPGVATKFTVNTNVKHDPISFQNGLILVRCERICL